jgi:hypothetical protein
LEDESSSKIISIFKEIFAEYGLPEKIVSDSGSNYTSKEFTAFANALDIKTVVSSPYHHQSNGQAENAVKQIKHIMKKCDETKDDINNALLLLRSTPITGCKSSPAELLHGRRFKSFVPKIELDRDNDDHIQDLRKKQDDMKKYHDAKNSAEEEREFYIGQPVMVQKEDKGPWTHGMIIARNSCDHNNRSYKVKLTLSQRIITRNTIHLRPSKIPTTTYEKQKSAQADIAPTYSTNILKHLQNVRDITHTSHQAEKSQTSKPPIRVPQATNKTPSKIPAKIAQNSPKNTPLPSKSPMIPKAKDGIVRTRCGRVVKPPVKLSL